MEGFCCKTTLLEMTPWLQEGRLSQNLADIFWFLLEPFRRVGEQFRTRRATALPAKATFPATIKIARVVMKPQRFSSVRVVVGMEATMTQAGTLAPVMAREDSSEMIGPHREMMVSAETFGK